GDGGHGQVDTALGRRQFSAPTGQGSLGAAQDGLGRLNEQASQKLMAVAADTAAPLRLSTIVEGRIESDVLDELLGRGKAPDVTHEGPQGKGDHFANPAQS